MVNVTEFWSSQELQRPHISRETSRKHILKNCILSLMCILKSRWCLLKNDIVKPLDLRRDFSIASKTGVI
jgi:hypothetical protein